MESKIPAPSVYSKYRIESSDDSDSSFEIPHSKEDPRCDDTDDSFQLYSRSNVASKSKAARPLGHDENLAIVANRTTCSSDSENSFEVRPFPKLSRVRVSSPQKNHRSVLFKNIERESIDPSTFNMGDSGRLSSSRAMIVSPMSDNEPESPSQNIVECSCSEKSDVDATRSPIIVQTTPEPIETSKAQSDVVEASVEEHSPAKSVEITDSSHHQTMLSSTTEEASVSIYESSVSQSHQSKSSSRSQRVQLNDRLDMLLAAKRRAQFLPDGGARLDAKIEEVRNDLRLLDKKDVPQPVTATRPKPEKVAPSGWLSEMQIQRLYGTEADQRPRLYGGRMNEARKMEIRVVTQDAIEELHSALTHCPSETEETADPKGLTVPLMRHQRQALTWLIWRENKQPPGGILADDMGLGKTLTMIALVLTQRKNNDENFWRSKKMLDENKLICSNATLVICPASVVYQWEKEIEKRVRMNVLNTLVYHGPKREISAERLSSYDFVITSYSTVASEVGDGEESEKKTKRGRNRGVSVLLKIAWERVILDEAHVIKNPNSLTSKACCRLPAGKRWVLTGTPIHNCLKDLYALLKFLRCDPFDEWTVWKRWIENKSARAQERLNTIVKGVLLRRTKEQLCSITGKPLVSLPPKKFETHEVDLQLLERKIYDRLFEASKQQVAEFVRSQEMKDAQLVAISSGTATHQQFGFRNPFLPSQRMTAHDSKQRLNQSHILVLLLRLRQACTHLALMKEAIDIDAFGEDDAENMLAEQLNQLTLFDQNAVAASVVDNNLSSLFERTYVSTKINVVLKEIETVLTLKVDGDTQKMVVVSQWAKLLNIVGEHLRRRHIHFTCIDGSVKIEERTSRVEQFNARNRGPVVMLLSLTAGGVGLNLVGGNHLFLVDMHWNPALEQQACDRIYRLGQSRNVFVHKFLCKKTVEERVFALQNQKSTMASAVMSGAGKAQNLSKDDIKFLFGLNEPTTVGVRRQAVV